MDSWMDILVSGVGGFVDEWMNGLMDGLFSGWMDE